MENEAGATEGQEEQHPGFHLIITGQLSSVEIAGCRTAYCKLQLLHGPDWQLLGGAQDGITQITSRGPGCLAAKTLHFNFPLDVAYRSANVFGWPQLVACVYGADFWGRDVVKGYGATRLPTCIGRYDMKLRLFRPLSATWLQQCFGWATGMPAELADPRMSGLAEGREVLRVKAGGHVNIQVSIVTQGFEDFGYQDGSRTSNAGVVKSADIQGKH